MEMLLFASHVWTWWEALHLQEISEDLGLFIQLLIFLEHECNDDRLRLHVTIIDSAEVASVTMSVSQRRSVPSQRSSCVASFWVVQ